MLVILELAYGGLVFWAGLGGLTVPAWLIITKSSAARNFESSNLNLRRRLFWSLLGFLAAEGFLYGLLHGVGIFVLLITLVVLLARLAYGLKRESRRIPGLSTVLKHIILPYVLPLLLPAGPHLPGQATVDDERSQKNRQRRAKDYRHSQLGWCRDIEPYQISIRPRVWRCCQLDGGGVDSLVDGSEDVLDVPGSHRNIEWGARRQRPNRRIKDRIVVIPELDTGDPCEIQQVEARGRIRCDQRV